MKKTLLSICALALSLTASAQILETPKGKLIDLGKERVDWHRSR